MSKEELERIDDLGLAAWDDHKPESFADLFADGFEWRDVTLPEPIRTRDGVIAYMQSWFTPFPDMHLRRIQRVVGDDVMAGEVEFTGTNTGPLAVGAMEFPATGKRVVNRGAYFARVKDGKIVEFSSYPDVAGLLMQVGIMPGG